MRELPPGWEWTTIGEIAAVQLGRQRSPKNHNGSHMRPYLRSANVTWRGIDISDVKEMNFEPGEVSTFELQPGDLLLNEASGSPNEVGKPAIWRGEIEGCCFQNTLLRVRPRGVSTQYLYWYCRAAALSGRFGEAGRGVNIRHLGKQGLASFPLALPPLPEQERIVAAVEEHLSRLDAVELAVRPVRPKLDGLRKATISEVLNRRAWPMVSWAEVGETLSGRAFPSASYGDEGTRLLRPGNLNKSGRVTWGPKATTHLPDSFAADPPKYLLRGRHLLMNLTAQSLADDFLGRVCMSGDDDHFLLNQRIAKLSSPLAHSDYLFWVFRSSSFREFVAGLNTGSLIQHISTKQLASFVFPLPPLDDQLSLVEEIEAAVAAIDRTEMALELVPRRSSQLRRSILSAAFSGQLVPQDPDDEPASVLLERIRVERDAAVPEKRTRKAQAS